MQTNAHTHVHFQCSSSIIILFEVITIHSKSYAFVFIHLKLMSTISNSVRNRTFAVLNWNVIKCKRYFFQKKMYFEINFIIYHFRLIKPSRINLSINTAIDWFTGFPLNPRNAYTIFHIQ